MFILSQSPPSLEQLCREGRKELEALLSQGKPYDVVIPGEFYVVPQQGMIEALEGYFLNKRYRAQRIQREISGVNMDVFRIVRINLKELDELLDKEEIHGFVRYSRSWDELGGALPGYKRGDWKKIRDAILKGQEEGLFC